MISTKPGLRKTPISYYGGKQAIIGHIIPMIPEHDIYTEVFFGGGAVFFSKEPVRNETINDQLDVVINFYAVLRTNYRQLKKMIDASLISRTMHRQALFIIKKFVPADPVTLAWAFWYVCNFSFSCKIGGGIKYANDMNTIVTTTLLNKKKEFTEWMSERIENTQIENSEALKVLGSRDVEKAFHYLDPPYPGADQGHYSGYTFKHLQDLLDWCTKCKGKFILSNYNSELLDTYIEKHNWSIKEITHRLKAPRKSSVGGDAAKTEVLVYNFELPKKVDLFSHIKSQK